MIALRTATIADLSILTYWDTKAHVVASSGEDDNFDWQYELPRSVEWREMLMAEHDGRPIGIVQIIDPREEETHYWGEIEPNLRAIDIWLGEESDLSQGFGTQIMRAVIDRCFADANVKAIIIDPLVSNESAHRFYERLGFIRIDRRTFGEDDCFVYRMNRP